MKYIEREALKANICGREAAQGHGIRGLVPRDDAVRCGAVRCGAVRYKAVQCDGAHVGMRRREREERSQSFVLLLELSKLLLC